MSHDGLLLYATLLASSLAFWVQSYEALCDDVYLVRDFVALRPG